MPSDAIKGRSGPADHLLSWALIVSLVVHSLLGGGYLLGRKYHLFDDSVFRSKLMPTPKQLAELKKKEAAKQQAAEETPLLFMEVDPDVVTPEAPKNAKYYSSKNSQAANQADVKIETQTPQINGAQSHVPLTRSAPKVKPVQAKPAPPKAPQPQKETPEQVAKPKGGLAPGDLAMAKTSLQPSDNPNSDNQEQPQPHKRPRTLAEVPDTQRTPGEKMRQDGGVHRRLQLDSLDARGTPFGEYDRELVDAIRNHWWDLLDSKSFSRDGTGRVELRFKLNKDGRVTDMKVLYTNVGDLLTYVCQSAIQDNSPYAPWPPDMLRLIGADYREVTFTFYYE